MMMAMKVMMTMTTKMEIRKTKLQIFFSDAVIVSDA